MRLLAAPLLAAWLSPGCAHDGSADRTPNTADAPVRVTARVERDTFAIALDAPETVRVSAPAAATLSIEGRGEYHVNAEYPMRVRVHASPQLMLSRGELSEADAAELSALRARFELPFTCDAPGAHRIEAELEFALCTETRCVPQRERIALQLQARP